MPHDSAVEHGKWAEGEREAGKRADKLIDRSIIGYVDGYDMKIDWIGLMGECMHRLIDKLVD